MTAKILPKNKSKGVDVCGADRYYYIIRSDIGCYLRSTNLNSGQNLEIFSLHPSCSNGDHYLAHKDELFYILKGISYRRVRNLNTDEDAVVYYLHFNCRGGDHYLSAWDNFYIVFQKRGICHKTKNLNKDEDSVDYIMHTDFRKGLYYFGDSDFYYVMKPHDKEGVQCVQSTNFCNINESKTFSIHPSVVNFLPGGFGVTKGPAFGEWTCIKTITNDCFSTCEVRKEVTKKIGYEKEKMSSIENNWTVAANVSAQTGGLTALMANIQFSLETEYGGWNVNTNKEIWSQVTDAVENVAFTLPPNEKIFIWAYHLGLGNEPLLHCREMRIQDDLDPPTDVPLPRASL